MLILRSLIYQAYMVLLTLVLGLIALPLLLAPRRASVPFIRLWARGMLGGLKWICGLKYEVRGSEHIQTGPALYAGKHFAMWDIIAPLVLLKDPALVMKRELFMVPIFGWFAWKVDMIRVDRAAHASALKRMVAHARRALAAKRPIVIFPEGTRKKPGAPADYKPGVAALYGQLDVPCVPFALNSALFWQGPWRKPGTIVIAFLPPIVPGLKRAAFMHELETRIETAAAQLLALR